MPSCQSGPGMSTEPIDCEQIDISSLLAMLGEIPDPRKAKGAIYSLRYILSTSLVSTMTGAKRLSEIGRWAARIPQPLLARLGAPYDHFLGRYRVPSEKTIRRVLQVIDVAALDARIGCWLFAQTTWENGEQVTIAVDGKVMRGAWVDEKTQVKLLAALIHGRGLVVGQIRVPDDTNEITQVENLLDQLPEIPGHPTVTLDAAHTQDDTAKDIVKHGMDYVMTVKGNRPTLKRQTFERVLPLLQEPAHHEVQERGHGRIKNWQTWTTKADGIEFPHVNKAAIIRRDEFDLTGTRLTREYALALTSATGTHATASYFHSHVRGQWGIENEVHYIRDTAWREDDDPTYTGNTNHAFASLRNLTIGILRLNGRRKIKETLEDVAADRNAALGLLVTACSASKR